MGVFSYVASGMAEGAGRAAAGYGRDMARQADLRDAEEERRRREQATYERQIDVTGLREELRAQRTGAGGGGKKSPADDLRALADAIGLTPRGVFDAAGTSQGLSAEESRDAAGMIRGEEPQKTTMSIPAEDRGPGDAEAITAPKYMPGQAADMMRKSWDGLARVMGIANTTSAKDAAEGTSIEHTTQDADAFAKGDATRGGGAMVRQGKGVFSSSGTNELTGQAARGSVAESQIKENEADAVAKRAKAAGGGGPAGSKAARVVSRNTDDQGYIVLNFADGTTRRAEIDGQPVKSGEWGKRVDREVQNLRKTMAGMSMKEEDLRVQAETNLSSRGGEKPVKGDGGKTDAKGGGDDEFVVGKTYRDGSGNRAKYLGKGRWEKVG